jgi:hypothetical protein
MTINTEYNPGEMVWFFDRSNKPSHKEIKSIEFYKDITKEELYYKIVSQNIVYKENELFKTQQELYASLEE